MSLHARRRTAKRPTAPAASLSRAALGYVKPGTYEELRAVLSSGTVRLPKKLQQVASFRVEFDELLSFARSMCGNDQMI